MILDPFVLFGLFASALIVFRPGSLVYLSLQLYNYSWPDISSALAKNHAILTVRKSLHWRYFDNVLFRINSINTDFTLVHARVYANEMLYEQ